MLGCCRNPPAARQEHDALDLARVQCRNQPCDPVAEGMADQGGRADSERLDNHGGVARQVGHRHSLERPGAAANAPRLGDDRPVTPC